MKGKNTAIYIELFEIINEAFLRVHNRVLHPRCFRLDCESAVLRAIFQVYGAVKIRLCSVHILRNWRKKGIEYVGKVAWENNHDIKAAWAILRGCFFLPYPALASVVTYLTTITVKKIPVGLKGKFKKYVNEYLVKRYFSIKATYPNAYWSYFHDINDYAIFNLSTNSIEVINRKLKVKCGTGKISFVSACRILQSFKEDYLGEFYWKINLNHLNPRGRKVVAREAGLLNLVREFDDLPLLQQNQIETIVNYCTNCAFVSVVAQILTTVEKPDEDQLDLDHKIRM